MSYCRWSTDNSRCDLYCYADAAGGYTTHVASNRLTVAVFPVAPFRLLKTPLGRRVWLVWHRLHMLSYKLRFCVPINHPVAGRTFRDGTAVDFKVRLLELRMYGFRFPDHVLAVVDDDIADEALA